MAFSGEPWESATVYRQVVSPHEGTNTTSQISCIRPPDTNNFTLPSTLVYQTLLHHYHHTTSYATYPTNNHVFTRNSIRLRPQPRWRTDAQDPHRGRRSRGPNLHCPTAHREPNPLFTIRPRLVTIAKHGERRRHRRVINSYIKATHERRRNDGKPCTGLQSSKAELASSGRRCQAA